MKIYIVVYIMTACILMRGYRRFGGTRKMEASNHLQDYTVP